MHTPVYQPDQFSSNCNDPKLLHGERRRLGAPRLSVLSHEGTSQEASPIEIQSYSHSHTTIDESSRRPILLPMWEGSHDLPRLQQPGQENSLIVGPPPNEHCDRINDRISLYFNGSIPFPGCAIGGGSVLRARGILSFEFAHQV